METPPPPKRRLPPPLGGDGADDIVAWALAPTAFARLVVTGGNGGDSIRLDASNSFAFGDNGADTLLATGGLGNTLDGGSGRDVLVSFGSGMGEGNILIGGRGRDSYEFSNRGNLVVTLDAEDDRVVSDGDVLRGPADVITDYAGGEFIALFAPDRIEEVPLTPDPLTPADRFRPALGDGQHAVFRGAYGGDGQFTVDGEGDDLLVIWDVLDFEDEPIAQGSLVLLGASDAERVLIG